MTTLTIYPVENYNGAKPDRIEGLTCDIRSLVSILQTTDRNFHERFMYGDLVKLAVDVDKLRTYKPSLYIDTIINHIAEYVGVSVDDISYTTNAGVETGSHHVSIPKYYMESQKQNAFWGEFKQKYGYGAEVDVNGVHSNGRWFRLPLQTGRKYDWKNKVEEIKTKHHIVKGEMKDFILCYTDEATEFQYQPKNKLAFDKSKSIPCKKQKTTHDASTEAQKIDVNDKYIDLVLNVIGNNPDEWDDNGMVWDDYFIVAGALKTNGYDFKVFDDFSKLNEKKYDAVNTLSYWERINENTKHISLHALQNIAKKNPNVLPRYREWLDKHTDSWYKCLKNALGNFENITAVPDESYFAKLSMKVLDGKIFLSPNYDTVYIYHNEQWRDDESKNADIVKYVISSFLELYPSMCVAKIEETKDFNNPLKDPNDWAKKNLKQDDLHKLKKTLVSVNFTKNVWSKVFQSLKSNNVVDCFDLCPEQKFNLHYLNGVYELNTKKFRQRVKEDHITKILPYNFMAYDEIPKAIHDDVKKIFDEIHLEQADRDLQLSWLRYCLSGDMSEQKFKTNVGKTAGNGKSTEFSIHNKCFSVYSTSIDAEAFEKGATKRHKHLIDIFRNPIRFMYVEELNEKKLDIELIKKLVSGDEVKCEVMFSTTIKAVCQAKLNTASQYNPKLDNDSGIRRRLVVQQYRSKFFKPHEMNTFNAENPRHFVADKDMLDKFISVEYKNAYFHLLNQYDGTILIPPEMEEEIKEVLEVDDPFGEQINDMFVITTNMKDKIPFSQIEELIGKRGTQQYKSFKTRLEALGCEYKKDTSFEGKKQPCWCGLVIKTKSSSADCPDDDDNTDCELIEI